MRRLPLVPNIVGVLCLRLRQQRLAGKRRPPLPPLPRPGTERNGQAHKALSVRAMQALCSSPKASYDTNDLLELEQSKGKAQSEE